MKKIFNLLSPKLRTFTRIFILSSFIASVLEIVSISILVPLLNILAGETSSKISFNLLNLDNVLNSISSTTLIYLFIIIYILKLIYMVLNVFFQSYLNQTFINSLVKKMASAYVNQGFDFHSKNSSSLLFKNLKTETAYVGLVFGSITAILSDLILLTTVSICLLIINFKIVIISFLIIIPLGFIYLFLSKKTNKDFSIIRNRVDKEINRHIYENFTGIREVIFFNKKQFFIEKIIKNNDLQRSYVSYINTLSQSTKYYIELVLLLILMTIYSYYSFMEISLVELASTLIIFLLASIRLLPIIARMQGNLQLYNFYESSVDIVTKDISLKAHHNSNEIVFDSLEYIKGVNINFKYDKEIVFNEFNFQISNKSLTIIHGESGKGKSTLLDLITGNRKISNGTLFVNGIDVSQNSFRFNKIAFMSQKPFVFHGSLLENICFGRDLDQANLSFAIKKAGIKRFIETDNYDKVMIQEGGSNFSVGQIQRITLARCIYGAPSLIIMDEPTSAIDSETEEEFIKSVEEISLQIKIIIVTHSTVLLEKFENQEIIKIK